MMLLRKAFQVVLVLIFVAQFFCAQVMIPRHAMAYHGRSSVSEQCHENHGACVQNHQSGEKGVFVENANPQISVVSFSSFQTIRSENDFWNTSLTYVRKDRIPLARQQLSAVMRC